MVERTSQKPRISVKEAWAAMRIIHFLLSKLGD